jgi:hypothetical protein
MDLKDIKKISIKIPDNLNELEPDLNLIINTTNTVIYKYLEKQIYKSIISESNKEKLNIIFTKNKKLILEPL